MSENAIVPFRHQTQLMMLPWAKPNISQFFLIGGYFSAKTTTLKLLTMLTISKYWKHPVVGALGAPTISFLEKTLLADLQNVLEQTGSKYTYNSSKHILRIGNMTIRMIQTGQPKEIYGHNLSFFYSDEHDELEQTKALDANQAIQERVRIPFPDGRDPFSVIATTAQGLRGTYRIVENLKEEKQPYALVRGRTEDNTTLRPDYLRRLKALYNEEEQEAFLNGKFVNLTTGRVYYAYNEAVHFQNVEPIQPHETVHIGQDLNEGYSKGTACVIRGGMVVVVREFSFKAIGYAPRLLREAFPHNRIVWYPDNSGKPIMGGYVEEIEHYQIETVYAGRNPSILDRIFIGNKLFLLNRMVVSKECPETSMVLKTRQFDEKGVPEKGKGEKAPDHRADSFDYVVFRLVVDHEEFMDLYELTPSAHKEQ